MAKNKKSVAHVHDAQGADQLSDHAVQIAEWAAKALVVAEHLGIKKAPLEHFWLAPAQRDVLLSVPPLSKTIRVKVAKNGSTFTVAEVASMTMALAEVLPETEGQKQLGMLLVARHLLERLQDGIVGPAEPKPGKTRKAKADPTTLFQFKITLAKIEPPIWRRIQVHDCTLDKLHEHIQTAMGWTNSHLHQFKINDELYGDPMLMEEDFEERGYQDSTTTTLSAILPKTGKRLAFVYEYDFGDGWDHDIVFEGRPKAEPGRKYPLCIEGERACPPEDVGGSSGYEEFLETIANPDHEEHEQMLRWVGGKFDPEDFDPGAATKAMKKGLPDWRNEERF